MEEALHEITSMHKFAQLSLTQDSIPEDTTIMNFRHRLEKHDLAKDFLGVINGHLGKRRLSLRQSTIVDATIIRTPNSAKNREGKHDPKMHQAKKRNQYFFWIETHIGVDDESGLEHNVCR